MCVFESDIIALDLPLHSEAAHRRLIVFFSFFIYYIEFIWSSTREKNVDNNDDSYQCFPRDDENDDASFVRLDIIFLPNKARSHHPHARTDLRGSFAFFFPWIARPLVKYATSVFPFTREAPKLHLFFFGLILFSFFFLFFPLFFF